MKPIAEIFSQGEELVSGQTIDSNAAWLSQQLCEMGFRVKRHTAVGDNLADLIALFQEIAGRADCCICSGGLGPTIDDLTAQAVSVASGYPLVFDELALQQIQQFFTCRQRFMPEANRKQAYLPETAMRIDNALGTAPGFALQFQRCWFVFLPGVPREMEQMFLSQVKEQLRRQFLLQPDKLVSLRSFGIGESSIQQCLSHLNLPADVQLGFRAKADEVQTKLQFPVDFPSQQLQTCVQQVAALIGDYVFAINEGTETQDDLPAVIDRLMQENNYTLAVLETASQGLIAAKCVARSWLVAVDVNISRAQLAEKWPVNLAETDLTELTKQLAVQVRQRWQTDFALVQLYSGDATAYSDKDGAIVLYNALHTVDTVRHNRITLAGTLKQKQNQSALQALDLLRRHLQHKCL